MSALSRGRWRPILRGAAREQALGVVDAIASAVRKKSRVSGRAKAAPGATRPDEQVSLAGGRAGQAVLYAYLAAARPGNVKRKTSLQFLNEAADGVSSVRMSPSLYGGFTGVAWAMAHVERLTDSQVDDVYTLVDETLIDFLGRSPWRDHYDLVSGLVGFGVYAIERLPDPAAVECLKRVVDRLDDSAGRGRHGTCWFTRPDLLYHLELERSPNGYYNLGVAHGVPGVIALLGAACAAGVARRKARRLLDGAVAWLEAQRLPARAGSIFPSQLGPGIEPAPCRSAWCYGDPGIAATLMYAARSVGEPAWERRALYIALRAAERPPEEAGVIDAGLCHGAAGLGHLFNRMFQATGEKRLGEAARFWFRRTLELRRPGRGVAGYLAWGPGEDEELTSVADPGLLTGAAGIALALLAAATRIEPSWDRMLLVSIPPRLVK